MFKLIWERRTSIYLVLAGEPKMYILSPYQIIA